LMVGTAGSLASLGGRAWVASALVHGSLAAVVAVQVHGVPSRSPSAAPSVQVIDIETVADVPPPPPVTELPLIVPPVNLARVSPSHAALASAAKAVPLPVEPEADPPPVATAPQVAAAPPTFVMSLPVGSSPNAKVADAQKDEVVDEAGVATRAEVAYGPLPVYPLAARVAQIETDVPVEIVVSPRGTVLEAHVQRRVGYGLEDSAIAAVKQYRFTPAARDGHAVAVRMLWTMQFRLQ
jgi:protein TonB